MKTTIQNMSWKNWKINVALLVLGLTLSGVILEARGGKPSSQTSICVAFDDLAGDRVKSDGGSYCDSEPDVAANSAPGFILITDDNAGPRKLSLDFQVPIRIDKAALLAPSGLYEARTWLNAQNDALANCIGERPTGTMILSMTPGQQLYAGLLIDFTDGKGGRWLLSFGDAVCRSDDQPRCPVLVTAVDDNGDGLTDRWKIETTMRPSGEDSWAYLAKFNKRQQWEPAGIFQMPFGLEFAKE